MKYENKKINCNLYWKLFCSNCWENRTKIKQTSLYLYNHFELHVCFWQVWLDEESPGNDWLLPCFRCNVLPNHRHAMYFRRNIFSPLLMVYAFFQFVIELPYWRYSGHSKCHSLFVLMDTFVWAFVFFEKRALSRIFIRLLLLSRKQICHSVYLSSIMQHTNNTEHGTN